MMLKFLCWFPRVIAILAILIMIMLSLDVFAGGMPQGYKIMAFVIHNIPALMFIIALVVAWKNEIIGGSLFILFSITLAIFFGSVSGNPVALIVISPFFLSGILFIVHQVLEKGYTKK
jgi:hypothetical protein